MSERVRGVSSIRRSFPALRRMQDGKKVSYFDGPGGSQVPISVARTVAEYLCYHNANRGWEFASSKETDEMIVAGRSSAAAWVGGRSDEISFGASMTAMTFQLSRVLARTWNTGDNLVVTQQDHNANVDPWRYGAADRGVEVRQARVRSDGSLDIDHLASLLDRRTRLVAFSAASNVTGLINDVSAICSLARESGALSFVDSVHYSGHLAAEVHQWGCDFLACSAYKFYGPRVGILWTRKALLDSLEGFTLAPAPSEGPSKFERGILNHEGIAGISAALDYLGSLVLAPASRSDRLRMAARALHARGEVLFERLWSGLGGIRAVTLFGPPPDALRTSTLSFTVSGTASAEVARALGVDGIFISHGNFYAKELVESFGCGKQGLVRAGCMAYTSSDDVDRLIDAVRRISR